MQAIVPTLSRQDRQGRFGQREILLEDISEACGTVTLKGSEAMSEAMRVGGPWPSARRLNSKGNVVWPC